jgi:ATP-dependent DNA helicase PIF1
LNSKKAKLLREADLIVWDEAPMAPIMALNTIDRLLRKIMNNDLPFGGKVIVLGNR